jgi:O-antigen/teichoic acid export membrane protein
VRRLGLLVASAAQGLLTPALNSVVSLLVIRLASAGLWGEFVAVLILVQLGAHVVAWGSKEYLLRELSLRPAELARQWQSSLLTRALFLLAWGLVLLLPGWPAERVLLVAGWGLVTVLLQAFDPLVAYRRDFAFAAAVQASGLLLSVAAILAIGPRLGLDDLIGVFVAVTLLKVLAFLARYRSAVLRGTEPGRRWLGQLDRAHLVGAFSFFLLGFSGMLQSRIDLYCVSLFLPPDEIGRYQVFMNLMIYVQSIAYFMLAPFLKSVYRLPQETVPRIAGRLFAGGLALLGPALMAAHLVLTHLYRLQFPAEYLLTGALFALPIYLYLPFVYALYRAKREASVLRVNMLGIAVNLALSVVWLPTLGMLGGVIASATAQWTMLAAYLWRSRLLKGRYALSHLP